MIWRRRFERHLSLYLAATLVLPVGAFASTGKNASLQATSTTQQQQAQTPPASDPASATPDTSPSTTADTPAISPPQATQQNTVPLGTAAAPATNVEGVPASTPFGAAIAPAKQKRIHRFSVRTVLVVGAVVAVGTVVGLTAASPSHP